MENKGLLYSIITKKKAAFAIILIFFILGGICFAITPKQQFPIIQLPVVIISATYPGASPTDMEELVTDKIEDVCVEAEGFHNVKSDSYNSVCVVRVMFDRELSDQELRDSMDHLRTDVNELKETELPEGITNLTFNDNAFETCGIILAFTGGSNHQMTEEAENLQDIISVMDGVTRTEVDGEAQQQVKITVDSSRAENIPVSLSELSSIIAYQNSIIPVGTLEFDNNEIYINSSGKFEDIEEIKNIIIYENSQNGAIVRLRDIADVEFTSDKEGKSYTYNGEDAVVLSVFFDEDVNITTTSDKVLEVVDDYSSKLTGCRINRVVCLADDVRDSINNFVLNLVESVLIVLVIIMIGMNIRNGSIVAFVIPFTIFLTFIAMKVFNIDVQFVSLASLIIALGMLVDNAIVVSDAIQVRIDNDEDRLSACVNGTKEVALPVFSSMLTTVAIFCIFYNLPGTMRRFVFSLPTIVIASLVFSYISSMLVTPLMCYEFMKKTENKNKKRPSDGLRVFFSKLLQFSLKKPALAILFSVLCVSGGIYMLSTRDLQLLPYSDKMLLDVNIETDNMFYPDNTKRAVKKAAELIEQEEPIEYYLSASCGRVPKYDFTSMAAADAANIGSFVVKLKDTGDMTKGDYCKYLENKLKETTSANVTVKEIGIIPKSSEEIQLSICGEDIDQLNNAANIVADMLKSDPDTRDVYTDLKVKGYNYYVNIKNELLNSSGLTKGEVQNELNIAMMGRTVTTYRADGKEYPVILESDASSVEDMKNLRIKSSRTGGKYKLSQVSDIEYVSDYSKISHHNGERCVTVTALPENGKSAVVIENKLRKALKNTDLGDVEIKYEGDVDMFDEIIDALITGGIVGVIAILLILYLQFYSLKRCFIIMLTVPFALVGSSLGLIIFGENLSLFAILGIISLIGVVVNNAIVLVDYIDGELAQGVTVSEACRTAVDKRFRPILLSSTTTIFGLVPLAFTGNVLFKGLSIAFMCGLFVSLIFTLVIIPTVYRIIIKSLPKTG